MKKLLTLTSAIAAVLLAAGTLSAFAQSVGVNFVPSSGGGVDNGDADSLASTEIAGVPGYSQANWNNLSNQGIGVTLTDSTGSATALTIAWASGNAPDSFGTTGLGSDGKLMDGAIDGSGNITDYTTLSGYTDVSSMPGGAKPMVYVGGLQAWLQAQGAIGYTIVIYQNDYPAYGTDLMWVESVSGSPTDNTMLAGPDLTPTLWTGWCCGFSGTYSQIPATATNSSSRAFNANYGIFTGLTNDAVLIRAGTADFQQGSINGFQIIPIFPTSIGVKFVSAGGIGAYGYGAGASSPDTLAPTDSAGVPGFAQVNWNDLGRWGDTVGSWAGSAVVLTDSAGHPTSLSIEWNSDTTGSSGSSDSTPSGRLMDGYIGSYNGGAATALSTNVYASSDNNYPLAYVGGLQAWYKAQGAIGYKIVLYVGGGPGWQTGQGYVESATGSPFNNTMVEGSILSPPLWAQIGATYSGTFTQITSTNSGSPTFGSGYMVFNGLTNDAVLLRTANYVGLNGFQIIPIFASQASVGVHFVNNGVNGLQNGSPDALSPATSAGAPGYAQNNWNNFGPDGDSVGNWGWATWINGGPGSPVVVNDGSGGPTSLQISWGSAGNGSTGTATSGGTAGTPNGDLMDGFLTTWDGAPTFLMTNSGPVYFADPTNQPLASISGLQSWLAGYPGAVGYSVVLYYSGIEYYGNCEGYVNAATGDIVSGTLTEVGAAAPHVFGQSGTFAGTFVQATGTDSGSATAGANYMVFTGLTNDTIVIHEHMLGYQGVWNGFQIVPIFGGAPTASAPTLSRPSPVYAGMPVTLAEAATPNPANPNLWYQWQTDNGAGGPANISIPNATNATYAFTPANSNANYSVQFQVIVTNVYGAVTSSVAAVAVVPVPTNGQWTARFQMTNATPPAAGSYTGVGVLGTNGFWNPVNGGANGNVGPFAAASDYLDDGSTHSGIECTINSQSFNGAPQGFPANDLRGLLSQYVVFYGYYPNAVIFSNVPSGTYNLAFHGTDGQWADKGTTYIVHGANGDQTAVTTNKGQYQYFVDGDNSVIVTNVQVTGGVLNVDVTPTSPSTVCELNAAEIQLVSLAAPSVSSDASLSYLALSPAGTLSPAFDPGTTNYTATNAYMTSPVTVLATNTFSLATNVLFFNGSAVATNTGLLNAAVTLTLGAPNLIQVQVTAQDGVTVSNYFVAVTMLPNTNSPPVLTNSVSGGSLLLNWGADRLGYRLLTQTNNLNKGVSANIADWGMMPGSDSITSTNIAIIKATNNAYYRLVYP